MKFITMIILFLVARNNIRAVPVGLIRQATLTMTPSSNLTMNGSTCNDCLCVMVTIAENSSIISLNCYADDINHVICQLFTITTYNISSFYQMETNVNSTFYYIQLPVNHQPQTTTSEGSTEPQSSQVTTMPTATTVSPIVTITQTGDPIVGLYNTTVGGSTGGKNGTYSNFIEYPAQAIDQSTSTKYLNFGSTGSSGLDTGFYVTPTNSNVSIAIGLRFATGNDFPERDPIAVTLEGSNIDSLDDGSSWTLIYNGSTGIDKTIDPGRNQYVTQQNFSNEIAYRSYRLLITAQRSSTYCVQYSEIQIIGYV